MCLSLLSGGTEACVECAAMRIQNVIVVLVVVALGVLAVGLVDPSFLRGLDDVPQRERARAAATEAKRDFMFQIAGYRTENQGGQTFNMYFHYLGDVALGDAGVVTYEDLRAEVLEFMGNVDASENPYWETLNQELCTELISGPIKARASQPPAD